MALSSREPSPEQSPLSLLSSDDDPFEADEEATLEMMPPAKRQKIGTSSTRATPISHIPEDDALSEVSSDTDGEIPNSPSRQDDDDNQEQVAVCAWAGCDAGDLENMDRLVEHIHNEHIESRQKKYTCEWSDCQRKSITHASGYALKAHMRSHTREKPFYCALPECDRAFTRSDALAKHMRTVHEIEALRPSDPIPKVTTQPSHKVMSRLKLIVNKNPNAPTKEQSPLPTNGTSQDYETIDSFTTSYPTELGITAEEEALGAYEMWRLFRRQVHWAEGISEELKKEIELLEEIRRQEYVEKEILLDHAIKTDVSYHERRQAVLAGHADISTSAIKAAADSQKTNSSLTSGKTALDGQAETESTEDKRDAATVLASLNQG